MTAKITKNRGTLLESLSQGRHSVRDSGRAPINKIPESLKKEVQSLI